MDRDPHTESKDGEAYRDFPHDEGLDGVALEELILGNDPEAEQWSASGRERMRVQRRTRWHAARPRPRGLLARAARRVFVRSDGFHFALAFVGLVFSMGMLGYALSLAQLRFSLFTGMLVIMSGLWFCLRWVRWLDQTNYLYRLMHSLGENAENLLGSSTWRHLRAGLTPWRRGRVLEQGHRGRSSSKANTDPG